MCSKVAIIMCRILSGLVLLVCVSSCIVPIEEAETRFSRPTVEVHILDTEPVWHKQIYEDGSYRFVYRHDGDAEYTPGLIVQDFRRNRWLEITALSTEHVRLGHSPDIDDIPLMVGWDYRRLSENEYIQMPLTTYGSINFPDRITFNQITRVYRLDFNSNLDREESLTSFWIRKADLDVNQ